MAEPAIDSPVPAGLLSVGTTAQVADAHAALDTVDIPAGPLAYRALTAVGRIDRLQDRLDGQDGH